MYVYVVISEPVGDELVLNIDHAPFKRPPYNLLGVAKDRREAEKIVDRNMARCGLEDAYIEDIRISRMSVHAIGLDDSGRGYIYVIIEMEVFMGEGTYG